MIKVFTAGHCTPCHEIAELIRQGKFSAEDVDLVDIETEEGFKQFQELFLVHGDAYVPMAHDGKNKCDISIKDGMVNFTCGQDSPSAPGQESTPPDSEPAESSGQ